jgi:predicted TIM-barrel fold metal-dependent hydrolase
VIDTGYPAPDKAMSPSALVAASGTEYVALLRLEVEFQKLIVLHDDFDALVSAVGDLVYQLRAKGFVGFKSIAAYRTGLAIERWDDASVRHAFGRARAEVAASGKVRLGYKPLLDTLLHIAFEAAAEQRLPVQFHVGYGDPDVDIRQASPLELRALFEEPAYRSMPIVMLHGCWPYFREGAYLAAVYGNAYLDVSYSIPFLSRAEMTSMTRAALGAAPFSKVMYSSDGVGIPEMHWMGAIEGRHAIGTVLGEMVDAGEMDEDAAGLAGRMILNVNAARLYGLTEAAQ